MNQDVQKAPFIAAGEAIQIACQDGVVLGGHLWRAGEGARTGTVIISWMFERGLVSDVQTGVEKLRSLRPSFGLSSAQADLIERG